MTLHPPFCISSRLLPAIKVGDVYISIDYAKRPGQDGRVRFKYYIDAPTWEHEDDDLQAPRGDLQDGMAALLDFLFYDGGTPHHDETFPKHIGEWACCHLDELEALQLELSETPDLITTNRT